MQTVVLSHGKHIWSRIQWRQGYEEFGKLCPVKVGHCPVRGTSLFTFSSKPVCLCVVSVFLSVFNISLHSLKLLAVLIVSVAQSKHVAL